MIPRFQNIGKVKLTGDHGKDIQAMQKVMADFELYICGKATDASNPNPDLTTLQAQVKALQNTTTGLGAAIVATTSNFIPKRGNQIAILGSNTLTFDISQPFSTVPVVSAWLVDGNGFGNAVPDTITTTGMIITVTHIEGSGTIYYIAVGS